MLAIIQDGGIERYDDLHIDRIDVTWKAREAWIQGGLKAFQLAIKLRDIHNLPFTVGLGISLQGREDLSGVDFESTEELSAKLSVTPPSLYLFNRGTEFHLSWLRAIEEGNVNQAYSLEEIDLFRNAAPNARCHYMEFLRPSDDVYIRSVFITE
jgi:hypothetical protein